jgi:hypothetical protein
MEITKEAAALYLQQLLDGRLGDACHSPEIRAAIAHLRASPAPAAGGITVPDGWVSVKDRLPPVAEGGVEHFIVACKRAHNGQTYVFEAAYLNQHLLDDAQEDCERPFTGWHDVMQHPDYDMYYQAISDEITHWMPKPAAPSAGNALPADSDESPLHDEGPFYQVAKARGFTDFGLTIRGDYSDPALQSLREKYDAELAAAAAPTEQAGKLPPMPEYADMGMYGTLKGKRLYTADQMTAYGHACSRAAALATQPADRAAAPAAIDMDALVPGIPHPTTYADLARISPNALWNRWHPTSGKYPDAKEAFIAARTIPFVPAQADHSAQAQAGEAALPETVAWMWEMHGWAVTAHGKHRAIKRYVDLRQPPKSTQESPDFIKLTPLCGNARALAAGAGMQERDAKGGEA